MAARSSLRISCPALGAPPPGACVQAHLQPAACSAGILLVVDRSLLPSRPAYMGLVGEVAPLVRLRPGPSAAARSLPIDVP